MQEEENLLPPQQCEEDLEGLRGAPTCTVVTENMVELKSKDRGMLFIAINN